MKKVVHVCDHCGDTKETRLCEYEDVGLELCSDCQPKLREHFAAFGHVRHISSTVHMQGGGMKNV